MNLCAMIGVRFIFTVFTVTILLIGAVFIRTDCDRIYYEITSVQLKADRLKQKLRQKQLLLESYISPSSLIKSASIPEENNIEDQ